MLLRYKPIIMIKLKDDDSFYEESGELNTLDY